MGNLQIFLIGVGLSMDAFAISLCQGLLMKKVRPLDTVKLSGTFGFFQYLMPIIGFYAGSIFSNRISKYGNFVAFIILGYLGLKMIMEGRKGESSCSAILDTKALLTLGMATSIDALVVGLTFTFIKNFQILQASSIIGVTTFFIAAIGVFMGTKVGTILESKSQYLGGSILVLIGLKSLVGIFA